jgi:hypothetical protein
VYQTNLVGEATAPPSQRVVRGKTDRPTHNMYRARHPALYCMKRENVCVDKRLVPVCTEVRKQL